MCYPGCRGDLPKPLTAIGVIFFILGVIAIILEILGY